jgi:hypothetical protein
LSVSSTAGELHVIGLPCQNWSSNARGGYFYKDSDLSEGTVKKATWKNGQFKAVLHGKGPTPLDVVLVIGVDQGFVNARLVSGSVVLCTRCDDTDGKNGSDGKTFLGKGTSCGAPPTCP